MNIPFSVLPKPVIAQYDPHTHAPQLSEHAIPTDLWLAYCRSSRKRDTSIAVILQATRSSVVSGAHLDIEGDVEGGTHGSVKDGR